MPTPESKTDEIDHDIAGFLLQITDRYGRAISCAELVQQGNRVMVVAKAHGLPWFQGVECAEDGGVTEAFGNATRVKWVDRFGGDVVGSA